jgi:glycosyltransferase involved in cell wall biosynthesis
MEKKPLFSVLIANYNNGGFIIEAIESVYKQTYPHWEIIIVDDCSTDNSEDIIKTEIQSDPRIKFYKNERNSGCGFTKRRCVELATGGICGFLDPDDALVENSLEISAEAHLSNPNLSIAFSNSYSCDADLSIKGQRKLKPPIKGKSLLDSFSDGVAGFHFASFKMSAYEKTDGIDPICLRAVDMDLYYKLEEVGNITFLNEPLYKYRIHDFGISLGSSFPKALSWHFYVIIQTCKRRGLKFEDFIPDLIEKDILNPVKQLKDYKTGQLVLRPLRFIKRRIFRIV